MLYLAYKLPQHKNRPYLCLIKSVWIPLFPAHVAKVIFGCERFSLFLLTGRTCDLGKRGTKNHLYLRSGWTRNVWNGVKKTICIFLRVAAPSKGNDKHLVSATNWYTPDPNQTTRTLGRWRLTVASPHVAKLHLNTPQRQQPTVVIKQRFQLSLT